MKKEFPDYFLGLDIGTDSVGWAVTDENYKLQKLNGKTLWGIRLFEGGKTAEERRNFRVARRRLQRRIQRLRLLQEFFYEEINKIDDNFFRRLEESFFQIDDKTIPLPYSFFADKGYTDADYHKEFPTIYHLRKALIEPWNKKYDIRLVYLAIHHILKNRGHFLFEGQDMQNIEAFDRVFQKFLNILGEELDIEVECKDISAIERIFRDKKLGKKAKSEELSQNLIYEPKSKEESKNITSFISLIVGSKVKLSALFDEKDYDEAEIAQLDFSSGKYDDDYDKLASILEDRICCVDMAKAIYDWALLADIRQGYKYLSEGKVATYKKHMSDLAILKKLVKESLPNKYDDIFEKENIKGNYASYVAVTHKNGRKIPVEKNCNYDEFSDYLKKLLKGMNNATANTIISELENKTFLPKQKNKDNSVIPYQMHKEELIEILKNASRHYDFLNKADESGITPKEKIEKLLTFRIPYYVGPINDAHKDNGANCWIVKNSQEKIRPWNFEKVVNIDACAEAFIRRMTNKCTYLTDADVLPKNSLLYSEFMVLNELSNLRINGELIDIDTKQLILNDLFKNKNNKKVTQKKLRDFLLTECKIDKEDYKKDNLISGIDGDFKSSLSSFIELRNCIGDKINDIEMSEELIRWIVLFGNDRKILEKRIKTRYLGKLSEEEIKAVTRLKFTGWGSLSREFLEDIIQVDKRTGECVNIINALRGGLGDNLNLMQLLSGNFDYVQSIEDYNNSLKDSNNTITYENVKNLYVSPAVKRGIWQTLTIVKEIRKFMGKAPLKVFVEVAREEDITKKNKRTKSRKDTLSELYKSCKNESRNWLKEIESKSEGDFRSDQLYLYYTQMGRCMYSGEPIDLAELSNKNVYDIDHIYPQSKVKDDSIENRVLVKKVINQKKDNNYPVPPEIQAKMADYWRMLYTRGFIGKKKLERLTRVSPFSDIELADFIARQLVETRQSTKAVAQILEQIFPRPNTEIVYVKAGNVSDFRHKYDMIKVRNVNDLHHAKDAFLNIVVGNVYNTKFTHSPLNFLRQPNNNEYSLRKMFDFNVERKGKIAWKADNNETLLAVKATMAKNDILFTRYAVEQKGGLFDQTILKKGNGQQSIKSKAPLTDIKKYGGYNKIASSYYMLVEHLMIKGKKQNVVRSIEYVPITKARLLEQSNEDRINYCKNELGLNNPIVIIPKIKINTLFSLRGSLMHLSGRTNDRLVYKGANQLKINYAACIYIKDVIKYLKRCSEARSEIEITEYDHITSEKNIEIYKLFLEKLKSKVYAVSLASQISIVESGLEVFKYKLSLFEQCFVLEKMLKLFACTASLTDLQLINGGSQVGRISTSKIVCDDLKIINQSPTGVFEQIIDLNTCKP